MAITTKEVYRLLVTTDSWRSEVERYRDTYWALTGEDVKKLNVDDIDQTITLYLLNFLALWTRSGLSGTALDHDSEDCVFESQSGRWGHSAYSPSSKLVPDDSWGRLGSEKRGMAPALHVQCPRHGGVITTRRSYDQHGYEILYLYLLALIF